MADVSGKLLAFILVQLVGAALSACDLDAATKCNTILRAHSEVDMLNDGISKVPNADTLDSMCGTLKEFKRCFEPLAPACRSDVLFIMTMGTIEKTLNYLCIEGYYDIIRYSDCWNRTEVAQQTARCHQAQKFQLTVLKQQVEVASTAELNIRFCSVLETSRTCMSEVVRQTCGEAPSCLIRKVMDRAIDGLTGVMKCPEPQNCTLPKEDEKPADVVETNLYRNVSSIISTTEVFRLKTTTDPNGAVSGLQFSLLAASLSVFLAILLVTL